MGSSCCGQNNSREDVMINQNNSPQQNIQIQTTTRKISVNRSGLIESDQIIEETINKVRIQTGIIQLNSGNSSMKSNTFQSFDSLHIPKNFVDSIPRSPRSQFGAKLISGDQIQDSIKLKKSSRINEKRQSISKVERRSLLKRSLTQGNWDEDELVLQKSDVDELKIEPAPGKVINIERANALRSRLSIINTEIKEDVSPLKGLLKRSQTSTFYEQERRKERKKKKVKFENTKKTEKSKKTFVY